MGRKRLTYEYTHDGVKESVLRHAKGARLQEGWAEQVAERVANEVDKWIDDKDTVTEDDLRRYISKTLKEICPDIAFAYRNHDKII